MIEIRVVTDVYQSKLQDSVNDTIEDMCSSGYVFEDIIIEVANSDSPNRYVAVLVFESVEENRPEAPITDWIPKRGNHNE